MADYTLSFYIDQPAGGGGSIGGATYGSSSYGSTIGGPEVSISYPSFVSVYNSPFVTEQQKQQLYYAALVASQGFPYYGQAQQLANQRAYNNLLYTTSQAAAANAREYNTVIGLPNTSGGIGLTAPTNTYTQPAYTGPTTSGLQEVSNIDPQTGMPIKNFLGDPYVSDTFVPTTPQPTPYSGPTYTASQFITSVPNIGAMAAYNAAKQAEINKYNTAQSAFQTYTQQQIEAAQATYGTQYADWMKQQNAKAEEAQEALAFSQALTTQQNMLNPDGPILPGSPEAITDQLGIKTNDEWGPGNLEWDVINAGTFGLPEIKQVSPGDVGDYNFKTNKNQLAWLLGLLNMQDPKSRGTRSRNTLTQQRRGPQYGPGGGPVTPIDGSADQTVPHLKNEANYMSKETGGLQAYKGNKPKYMGQNALAAYQPMQVQNYLPQF